MLIFSLIILENVIISRFVLQNPLLFIFIIWVSKSPNQRSSYKWFFHIKSTDFISYLFFWILSSKYQIAQRVDKQISVHLARNDLDYLSKECQFFLLSFDLVDSSGDSSKNWSVNQLSYHHCSYFWFDRVNLLLILTILSLSLGLVLSILFLIWCSDLLDHYPSSFCHFCRRCQSFLLSHRFPFVILIFYLKDSCVSFL